MQYIFLNASLKEKTKKIYEEVLFHYNNSSSYSAKFKSTRDSMHE